MLYICYLCRPLRGPAAITHMVKESEVTQSCLTLCDPMEPTRLLHPWDFPGKSTGVGCHFLPQGIFLTQGSNPDLPHCRQTLYHLSYQGSPHIIQELQNKTFNVCMDSVQLSSVAQSCPTLCNPMDCSTPGFPVHHQLLELP